VQKTKFVRCIIESPLTASDRALVAHLVLGHMAFHGDATDGVFGRLELKGADVADLERLGYLAVLQPLLVAQAENLLR